MRGERPIIEMFPYFSRIKGAIAFKLKKATAPDPWRAELVESAIELKRLHGTGYPRNDDGELLVINDGDEVDGADDVPDIIDEIFDEFEDENSGDENEIE